MEHEGIDVTAPDRLTAALLHMHRTVSLPAVLLSIAGLMVLGRVNHADLRF
jgi:hypothetical protein